MLTIHGTRKSRAIFKSFLRTIIAVAIGATVLGSSAFAQLAGKGELKGTAKDSTGAVVPNATVTATEATTGIAVTHTTNAAGEYDLSPLDAGIYTVTVTASGFEKLSQADVHVNSLEIADFNPVLTVGSAAETVTVTTAPPALETSNAVLGATMEQEVYSALPIQMGAWRKL